MLYSIFKRKRQIKQKYNLKPNYTRNSRRHSGLTHIYVGLTLPSSVMQDTFNFARGDFALAAWPPSICQVQVALPTLQVAGPLPSS